MSCQLSRGDVVYAFSAAFRNITIRSGLVWLRIGGVKLKSYSGSFEGRSFQPFARSQKNGSPGFMVVEVVGKFEMATCAAVRVGEVKVDGLMEVVCDRPEGRIVPYLVDGQSLSSKIIASRSFRPDIPMDTSVCISKRCFGSWRSSR